MNKSERIWRLLKSLAKLMKMDEFEIIWKNLKELAKEMKENKDEIIVEGDLKNHVLKIKATRRSLWDVCIVSLTAAIIIILTAPAGGGASVVMGLTASTAAASVLGSSVATTAIAIGVASGGVGALTTLRNKYEIVEKNEKYIKLKRKTK